MIQFQTTHSRSIAFALTRNKVHLHCFLFRQPLVDPKGVGPRIEAESGCWLPTLAIRISVSSQLKLLLARSPSEAVAARRRIHELARTRLVGVVRTPSGVAVELTWQLAVLANVGAIETFV